MSPVVPCLSAHSLPVCLPAACRLSDCRLSTPACRPSQAAVIAAWVSVQPPVAADVFSAPGVLHRVCVYPRWLLGASLAYNGVILLACAAFAFRTRNLPDNFSEARFICFCVYSACVLWLAFVPAYFSVASSRLRTMLLSLLLLGNATVPLCCLFVPKLYAIYCVQSAQMHVRGGGGGGSGGGAGKEATGTPLKSRKRVTPIDE